MAKVEAQAERFGVELGAEPGGESKGRIPRPPQWGGFTLAADSVELWVSRLARIHDRARWTRELDESLTQTGDWRVERFQP